MIQERPQPVAMIVQLFAHPAQQSIPAELAAQQQGFDSLADRREQPFQTAARDRAVAAAQPAAKQLLARPNLEDDCEISMELPVSFVASKPSRPLLQEVLRYAC